MTGFDHVRRVLRRNQLFVSDQLVFDIAVACDRDLGRIRAPTTPPVRHPELPNTEPTEPPPVSGTFGMVELVPCGVAP